MNTDLIGKYYLGNGGIGDALIFLSTFYDDVEEANIVFLENNIPIIKELFELFPKLKKKLIIQNNFDLLKKFYNDKNCIGTGILPKNLDYSKWNKVNIFKEYKVKEFPNFVNLFVPNKKVDKQMFIQIYGSDVEGPQKQRIITSEIFKNVYNEFLSKEGYNLVGTPGLYSSKNSLKSIFETIKGSELLVGVDSFMKTFSAMCGIRTVVFDNIYDDKYLNNFENQTDYGHYIFLYPWSKIEFRTNIKSHQKSYEEFKKSLWN